MLSRAILKSRSHQACMISSEFTSSELGNHRPESTTSKGLTFYPKPVLPFHRPSIPQSLDLLRIYTYVTNNHKLVCFRMEGQHRISPKHTNQESKLSNNTIIPNAKPNQVNNQMPASIETNL